MSPANNNLIPDGDAAFLRVNNRLPAHALKPGEVQLATNLRFDEGKPRPRHGIAVEVWGRAGAGNQVSGSFAVRDTLHPPNYVFVRVTLRPETQYEYLAGNESGFCFGLSGSLSTAYSPTTPIPEGKFTTAAGGPTDELYYYLYAPVSSVGITATAKVRYPGTTIAYARFNDPNGVDSAVLLLDDWRDGAGEDGGRGRAYRIVPGNVPQEIDLNGHDLWGPCRIKQAHHTMFLARHGNERHYFSAAAVDAGADTITLNCAPNWNDGDLVLYQPESNSEIVPGPNPNAKYYVKTSTATVSLHGTKADALAGTGVIDLGTAVGKFYLERQADQPGPFGNGAPPLLLQPTATLSAFENGWQAVPTKVAITGSDAAGEFVTAASHRLQVGDGVTVILSTDGTLSKYARPLSDHTFQLYDTEDHALAGGSSGLFDITIDGQTGSVVKTGAAALPMPSLREFTYYKGRIIGIINGTKDSIVVSDPYDFLHYSIFTGPIPANLGESGNANWLLPLGEDALLIGKDNAVLAITGLSGASSGWAMDDVTREYGGMAPLAALNVGTDAQFLTRKGWASVVRTVAGEKLGVARTISQDIPEYFKDIDWLYASAACAETWNNRLFLSVPVKGQADVSDIRNNRTLVYNFLNQSLAVDQTAMGEQLVGRVTDAAALADAWEGQWTGDLLEPVAYARLKVAGDERLTFATPDGMICWFTDGFEDGVTPVTTSLTTRGYYGGARMLALRAEVNWDTYNPSLTVTAQCAGYNEQTVLQSALTFDRTQYLVNGQAAYDPETSTEAQFEAPHREDYSLSASELLVGTLDAHQNMTENLRLRVRDRAPQLIIANTQGSVRLNSVTLLAKPVGIRATRST